MKYAICDVGLPDGYQTSNFSYRIENKYKLDIYQRSTRGQDLENVLVCSISQLRKFTNLWYDINMILKKDTLYRLPALNETQDFCKALLISRLT